MSDQERLPVLIRPESVADYDAIRSLTARAFAGLSFSDGTEPRVIDVLRRANALALSLVAVVGEEPVGHIAFSEVGPTDLQGWFALGPVSVEPSFQRRRVGTQHRKYFHPITSETIPALTGGDLRLTVVHAYTCLNGAPLGVRWRPGHG